MIQVGDMVEFINSDRTIVDPPVGTRGIVVKALFPEFGFRAVQVQWERGTTGTLGDMVGQDGFPDRWNVLVRNIRSVK